MNTIERELDELEVSHALDLKRSEALAKIASNANAAGAKDMARKLGYEGAAFLNPPVHGLSHRKEAKIRFYNIDKFPREAIDHFAIRASSSKNPLVVARFADIVWEARRDAGFARLAFSGYLDSVAIHRKELSDDKAWRLIDLTDAVQRAVEIAVSLNDTALIARTERVCVDLFAWLDSMNEYRWGLEIIEALLEMQKRVDQDSLKQAYEFAQKALSHLVSQDAGNYKLQLDYAILLARLSQSLGDTASAQKWRKEVPVILAREARTKEGLVASFLYQQAAKAYLDLGMKEESDEMIIISQKKMQGAEFQKIQVPIEIPKEAQEQIVKRFTENKTPGGILVSISSSLELVPDYEQAVDIAKKTGGISSVIPFMLYEGTRRTGSATTPEEILQVRTARQFSMNCEMNCSLLLLPILDKAVDLGCSKDTFVSLFRNAKGLNPDRIELLGVGLDRFLAGDYISCIHVLVVQVEAWLRDLLDNMGGPTTYVKDQIVHVHTLGTILSSELIKRALGRRVWSYVNAILNDDLAFGLRDKVAHGLCEASELSRNKAALLIHVCLLLSGVVPVRPQQGP